MNWNKIEELVELKYIRRVAHPTLPLWLFNYSEKTQYEKNWTEETLNCRGLITDHNYNIIARPFKKFFNISEIAAIPSGIPKLFEKLDGSLGILYWWEGRPYIATRGSFSSEQAIKATEMLSKYVFQEDPDHTHLFEIIFPQNRIVVDYGMREELVYLGSVRKATGEYVGFIIDGFPRAKFIGEKSLTDLEQKDNEEGYVCYFSDGTMAKVKFNEYVRLHRLVTQVTARSIWDLLKHKQPFDELLERVPDEFYAWVKATKKRLEDSFIEIEFNAKITFDSVKSLPTRKEQAEIVKASQYPNIVFTMLDGRDYSEAIWRLLYPEHEKPFKQDE